MGYIHSINLQIYLATSPTEFLVCSGNSKPYPNQQNTSMGLLWALYWIYQGRGVSRPSYNYLVYKQKTKKNHINLNTDWKPPFLVIFRRHNLLWLPGGNGRRKEPTCWNYIPQRRFVNCWDYQFSSCETGQKKALGQSATERQGGHRRFAEQDVKDWYQTKYVLQKEG